MKSKLVIMIVIVCAVVFAVPVIGQDIDPGTGIKIAGEYTFRPAWSPDGKWIAHCGRWDGIWLQSVDGGVPSKLYSPESLSIENASQTSARETSGRTARCEQRSR